MSKFNIGDEVKIREEAFEKCLIKECGIDEDYAKRYKDKKLKIKYIDEDGKQRTWYVLEKMFFVWREDLLEKCEEESHNFKVGDRVIGNEKANDRYVYTTQGYKGVVTKIISDEVIEIDNEYPVKAECFDLYEEFKFEVGDVVNLNLSADLKDIFDNAWGGYSRITSEFLREYLRPEEIKKKFKVKNLSERFLEIKPLDRWGEEEHKSYRCDKSIFRLAKPTRRGGSFIEFIEMFGDLLGD